MSSLPQKTVATTATADHIELACHTIESNNSAVHVQEDPEIDTEAEVVLTSDDVKRYTENDDEALKAFANYDGGPLVLDKSTGRRLLRIIDWHLLPVL